MSKHLTLHVNDPCSESWKQMTPNQQGRHCMSCAKTVVDFTQMNDLELMDWWKNKKQEERTCGRFREDQLQREMPLPLVNQQTWWRKAIAFAAVLLFGGVSLFGQSSNTSNGIIEGTIYSPDKEEPIIGANIVVYSKGVIVVGTTTDLDGKYRLGLSKFQNLEEVKVEVSYLGYENYEIELDALVENKDVELKEGFILIGEVMEPKFPFKKNIFKNKFRKEKELKQTLRGKVQDAENANELIGANISVYDTDGKLVKGTTTDTDGRFEINLKELTNIEEYTVEISYIGYDAHVQSLAALKWNKKNKFKLRAGVELEEVVVTAIKSPFEKEWMGSLGYITKGIAYAEEKGTNEEVESDTKFNSTIFPNPFHDELNLNLSWPISEYFLISLYAIDSKLIFEKRTLSIAGENTFHIDISNLNLAAGSYVLRVDNKSGNVFSEVIVHARD